MRHEVEDLSAAKGIIRGCIYSLIMYVAFAVFLMWRFG